MGVAVGRAGDCGGWVLVTSALRRSFPLGVSILFYYILFCVLQTSNLCLAATVPEPLLVHVQQREV